MRTTRMLLAHREGLGGADLRQRVHRLQAQRVSAVTSARVVLTSINPQKVGSAASGCNLRRFIPWPGRSICGSAQRYAGETHGNA